MRYLSLSLIAILLIPFIVGLQEADAATWYNSSWLKARKITIDQTDIDTADLTDYPLYVNMTSVDIGTDAQADCDDFVFTDSTNVTKLNHEIETCDSTANWAEFWINIPTVSNTVDTVIYMYYDNAAATNQQNTQATWNSNYAAVWHLNGTFVDSTSTPITCTNSGSSDRTNDYIGDSRFFDKIDDYINCGSDSKVDNIFDGGGTVSLWLNASAAGEGNANTLVNKQEQAINGWIFYGQGATMPVPLRFLLQNPTNTFWTTNANWMATAKWELVVVTYNDDASTNDPLIYVNGTSRAITQTGANSAYVSDALESICIGNSGDGLGAGTCNTTATFSGRLDEVRFNNQILSANWIKADWECQRGAVDGNSCITVGAQGTEPVAGSTVTVTDEYALEDSVSVIGPGEVTVSDEYALEDSVSAIAANTVNPTDEYALEDSVTIPGLIVVTDEFALEDSAATNQITVSDEFALEDSSSGSTQNAVKNAIAIYLNHPTSTRLGGVFSGNCNFAQNYSMVGIWTNGTIRCMKLS